MANRSEEDRVDKVFIVILFNFNLDFNVDFFGIFMFSWKFMAMHHKYFVQCSSTSTI